MHRFPLVLLVRRHRFQNTAGRNVLLHQNKSSPSSIVSSRMRKLHFHLLYRVLLPLGIERVLPVVAPRVVKQKGFVAVGAEAPPQDRGWTRILLREEKKRRTRRMTTARRRWKEPEPQRTPTRSRKKPLLIPFRVFHEQNRSRATP